MLSKSAARKFFLTGTALCAGAFILLTVDTIQRVPGQTRAQNLTDAVKRGKHLWDSNNCMGCHTILGEGAYYAPELTKVYERRGPEFIQAMLKDPQAMYPGQRKMVKYDLTDENRADLVAFFKWIGEIDLNGYPAKTDLAPATATGGGAVKLTSAGLARPAKVDQLCVSCHSVGGRGGNVGPALDGVGSRYDQAYFVSWLRDPGAVKPGTKMPKLPLTEHEITELANYLSKL